MTLEKNSKVVCHATLKGPKTCYSVYLGSLGLTDINTEQPNAWYVRNDWEEGCKLKITVGREWIPVEHPYLIEPRRNFGSLGAIQIQYFVSKCV